MMFPKRLTRTFIYQAIPHLSADDFLELCVRMRETGWGGKDGNGDIEWLLAGMLSPQARRDLRARGLY